MCEKNVVIEPVKQKQNEDPLLPIEKSEKPRSVKIIRETFWTWKNDMLSLNCWKNMGDTLRQKTNSRKVSQSRKKHQRGPCWFRLYCFRNRDVLICSQKKTFCTISHKIDRAPCTKSVHYTATGEKLDTVLVRQFFLLNSPTSNDNQLGTKVSKRLKILKFLITISSVTVLSA